MALSSHVRYDLVDQHRLEWLKGSDLENNSYQEEENILKK